MSPRIFWIGIANVCSAIWASSNQPWIAGVWLAWAAVLLVLEMTSKATGGKA